MKSRRPVRDERRKIKDSDEQVKPEKAKQEKPVYDNVNVEEYTKRLQ